MRVLQVPPGARGRDDPRGRLGQHAPWWRHGPALAVLLVSAAALLEQLLIPLPSLMNLSGVALYPHDVVCALFVVWATLRLARAAPVSLAVLFLLCLASILVFNLFRGIESFGVQAAGNEARRHAQFLAAALLFASFGFEWQGPSYYVLTRVFFGVACALGSLCVARWALLAVNPASAEYWTTYTGFKAIRVVHANAAIFLGQIALLLLCAEINGFASRPMRRVAYLLWPAVILLQHRSVWAASLVGLFYLLFRLGRETRRLQRWAVAFVGITLGVALALALIFPKAADDIFEGFGESFSETTQRKSTFTWRIEGWQDLLIEARRGTLLDHTLGYAFGTGYQRVLNTAVRTEQPHNAYVETYLRFGAVGLAALLLLYLSAIVASWRLYGGERSCRGPLIEALLLTQAMFFVAYGANLEQGMVLGLCTGAVLRLRNQRSAAI